MSLQVRAQIPQAFDFLMKPSRYKVAYGGRGSGKSTTFAQSLIVHAIQEPQTILCTREFQTSIGDSVHKLLHNQIHKMGASDLFDIKQTEITGKNGSSFIFDGLRRNINNIRSKEGIKRCWIEEAHTTSNASLDVLIPTIRIPGSEIWISFNPDLEEDPVYKRFVLTPPPNCTARKVSWRDNPWFAETEMKAELEHLKAVDYDAYLNVWEGHCKVALEGAVYASELRELQEENRITKVPYDPSKPVSTFWDLGWADSTAVIFFQQIGMDYHIIDYMEDRFKKMDWYMQQLQTKGYTYKAHWLPHDAESNTVSNKTPAAMMREKGFSVQIVPRLSVEQGIQAARMVFPRCYFDEEKCYDLLKALRHYHYERIPERDTFKTQPAHTWASHGADSFRYFAVAVSDDRRRARQINDRRGTWMSA